MRTGWRGKALTREQKWWHTKRADDVESAAYALIRRHEARRGRMPGCVVKSELLVEEAGLEFRYFSDEDRPKFGLRPEDLGALRPGDRLLLVHDSIRVVGRENQTVGHELGHLFLHVERFAPDEQVSLGLDVEEPSAPVFRRTAEAHLVDDEEEPLYWTQEADFFSACLQMPADRYRPVAEARLREAASALQWRAESVERRLPAVHEHLQTIRERNLKAYEFEREVPRVFDTAIVEHALSLLERDHEGQVSKAAQRRRFIELGLVVDVADRLREETGQNLLPPCEFVFLAGSVGGTE